MSPSPTRPATARRGARRGSRRSASRARGAPTARRRHRAGRRPRRRRRPHLPRRTAPSSVSLPSANARTTRQPSGRSSPNEPSSASATHARTFPGGRRRAAQSSRPSRSPSARRDEALAPVDESCAVPQRRTTRLTRREFTEQHARAHRRRPRNEPSRDRRRDSETGIVSHPTDPCSGTPPSSIVSSCSPARTRARDCASKGPPAPAAPRPLGRARAAPASRSLHPLRPR